jgi:DNA-binding MarR family transcriptional regulator
MEAQAAMQDFMADPGFLLSRVGAAVRAGFKEVLAECRIRPLQYVILLLLDTGGASQQELCAAAGIDSGNMVELLDSLEALGYARRARDPRDRRRYVVSMTERGRSALAAELRPAIEQYTTAFLGPLTELERQRLASILGKLYITTAEGQPRPPRWAPESLP